MILGRLTGERAGQLLKGGYSQQRGVRAGIERVAHRSLEATKEALHRPAPPIATPFQMGLLNFDIDSGLARSVLSLKIGES